MFYTVRTPYLFKLLYRSCVWDMPRNSNKVYLSFDDGPHPEVTAFVLDLLRAYQAKGSFFCIGENVMKYPEMYRRIISEGHAVGNHTQHHKNGWKTSNKEYLDDIREAQQYIDSDLFRPPYGRVSFSQLRVIQQQMRFKPVMWSIVSGDFDTEISPERCAKNVLNNLKSGDIIVFHDSEKASDRLKYALPLVLEEIRTRGWVAEKLQ
ncbi:MAG TPA: polysaccharide deacetylase family protein [Chitinophagaceae bacterium]|nr:polysaccharide deacetylase family protein [Chitinophagaceae bacterium]